MFPLNEVENGRHKINFNPAALKPVMDYMKPQGRFRHLSEADVNRIQQRVTEDWEKLKALSQLELNPPGVTDLM
jgi:pyruvate/2-oxoacid:ferredoxin oxidoreductase beta subunit